MRKRGLLVLFAVPWMTGLSCEPDPPDEPTPMLVARPGGPYGPVNTCTPVTFNGLQSTSTPNQIAKYLWTCGGATTPAADCSKDSPTPAFTYIKTQSGTLNQTLTYTVTLVIEDTQGNRSQPATTTVRITQIYGNCQ